MVAEMIDQMNDSFWLEELLNYRRSHRVSVSRGTVFSTLKLMKEASLLISVRKNGAALYHKKRVNENLIFLKCCEKVVRVKADSVLIDEIEKICCGHGASRNGWIVNIQAAPQS